jgi:hypothetical protein
MDNQVKHASIWQNWRSEVPHTSQEADAAHCNQVRGFPSVVDVSRFNYIIVGCIILR